MVSPSKKKKVERRTKTGPSPSNSSAASGSRRDKCANSTVSKPLANRRIYLDIKNQASVKKLSEKLIALGGKLEQFLVKEVNYVVTDRDSIPTKRKPLLNQVPTPSPLPSFCSVSPATTDSPTDGLGNKKTRSRAEAMLERVKQQPQKSIGDVLDNALTWKIPIYPLNKFLVWIEKLGSKTGKVFEDQNTNSNASTAGRSVKVLTGSYLKIETGARPEFKQFTTWPHLGLPSSFHRSATPVIAASLQEKAEARSVNTVKKDLNSNEPSQRMTRKVGRTVKEASSVVGGGNGYCEICRIYYDQLDSHTVSAQHLKLVTDSSQYSQLDSIIHQNNLGANSLRKSLRIAKSPPPFLPPEMGGKQSSGSATPGALELPSRDLTRGLRLKECSVALGPPSPLLNGYTTTLKQSRNSKLSSPTAAAASPIPRLHHVMNGCARRSQRSQPLSEVLSDKETNDVLPPTPTKKPQMKDNLRSRKASSAQTPITPPPPERLPSPPPEKLSPPHLRSGSEKAMTRSDRSLRGSEDRALSSRCSVEKDKSSSGGCKFSEKEKSSSGKSSCQPVEVVGMTTRGSFRERSVDEECPTTKIPPPKSSDKPEKHTRHHERPRRGKEDRDEKSDDEESNKRKKKEPTPEEDFREERRRRREERMSCVPQADDDDKEKAQSHSSSKDKWCTSHDRGVKSEKSERNLRVKERPYYEEVESEESSPVYSSKTSKPPKASHKKKRVSTKSRVTKKRLSNEEKLIEDNKSYYKVEVLNSKLRSTEYFVNQKQAEERVNGDVTVEEVKPVVVRFKKIRSTELTLLSDEAENFMFGEPKKEYSEDEDEDEEDAQESSDGDRPSVKNERTDGSSEIHSGIKIETDSSNHSDLIPVKQPSSDELAVQFKLEDAECEDDEVIDEELAKLTYAFERPPVKEPWVDALTRQRDGKEFYIPMAHDYPKVILPYEVKKQRRRRRKSEMTPTTPNASTVAGCPSSPFHRKDRVSRLIQASIDDKPRKSPRRLATGKREVSASRVAPVLSSDNNTLKTSEEIAIEPEERCHASTLAIMSSLMRRRPMRECAEKPVSYEEESSLPETVESSGSNSNSMDAKALPVPELPRVPPTVDYEFPPGGDKIAEALLMGFTHIDNYEPASCLQVDPACVNNDLPNFSQPGLDMPVEEILRTYSSCMNMNIEENLAPVRTFPSFYRNPADSCASSDCSDFLGFMEDGQAATKKRKKRRNLTGWPVEKPRRKLKDKELGSSCLLLNNRSLTPEPARLTSAAVTPLSASSPLRKRSGRPPKIRPCLTATLPIPSPLASDHPSSPVSDYYSLPIKKKISRFGTRRSILKQ